MRHLSLTLAAYVALAPPAHAQPAQPKARLSALIQLSKRTDPQAYADVAHRLTNDPDATNRLLAAMVFERMVDASTPASLRAIATAALQAALQDPDVKVQQAAAKVLGTLTATSTPLPSTSPNTPLLPALMRFIGGAACVSNASIVVGTHHQNSQSFDLCAAFQRAAKRISWWPSSLSNPIALRVTLLPFGHSTKSTPQLRCNVKIATLYAGAQSLASGGAAVAHSGTIADRRVAERDCVEAVLENLLTNTLPRITGSAGSSSAGSATAGSSTATTSGPASTGSAGTSSAGSAAVKATDVR